MSTSRGIAVAVAALAAFSALSACAERTGTVEPSTSSSTTMMSAIADAIDVASVPGNFGPLEPGNYYIRPVVPEGPTISVHFTIPAEGWLAFIGGFKPGVDGRDQTVALHILNVTNLVRHGCSDHAIADPIGDTTEDLASALATLEPFEVVEAPSEVSRWGYDGTRLVLQVPELPTSVAAGQLKFTDCVENEVKSWIGRPLSYVYYGYSPGLIEEFWILDVDGQRLVVATDHFPDTPPDDMDELQAVLDSIGFVVDAG